MARGAGSRAGLARAVATGRRAWPVVLMAWERWQQLSDEDKERYRRRARDLAERGRRVVEDRRSGRGPRRPY